ncbi:hypothetical protein BDZ90DRAFT_158594 [Jaminaea rosea]|uniref:Secreted protein n=1 Tax=Jaminaea rosea TaxID=1569628 RepID=A0A316UXV6_9BASI|nr:hypothetical protein BDZ90DRAFT_158594 [Jaminaea rosea]PWN27975.1 hypothetical protein BDZ90DRAFT_158594 [Jaminaea rosea]
MVLVLVLPLTRKGVRCQVVEALNTRCRCWCRFGSSLECLQWSMPVKRYWDNERGADFVVLVVQRQRREVRERPVGRRGEEERGGNKLSARGRKGRSINEMRGGQEWRLGRLCRNCSCLVARAGQGGKGRVRPAEHRQRDSE